MFRLGVTESCRKQGETRPRRKSFVLGAWLYQFRMRKRIKSMHAVISQATVVGNQGKCESWNNVGEIAVAGSQLRARVIYPSLRRRTDLFTPPGRFEPCPTLYAAPKTASSTSRMSPLTQIANMQTPLGVLAATRLTRLRLEPPATLFNMLLVAIKTPPSALITP